MKFSEFREHIEKSKGLTEEQIAAEINRNPLFFRLPKEYTQRIASIFYACANNGFKMLAKQTGHRTLTSLCNDYKIPFQTYQNWICGKRTPPEYVTLLLGYAIMNNLNLE